MFTSVDRSPPSTAVVDGVLRDVPEAVASLVAGVHQGAGVQESLRDRLHDLEDLHRVADRLDLLLADLEDSERDAEQRPAALVEEGVPHP